MIDVRANQTPEVLEIKVTEKLSGADFDHLKPVIDTHIAESVHPKMLMIMEQFSGWDSAEAFWKDLKMDASYIGKFDCIAMIGDAKWEEWGTKLISPVLPAKIKFFKPEETAHARRWLKQRG